MKRLTLMSISIMMLVQLMFVPISFASDSIKFFSLEESKKEAVKSDGKKMMLKQEWYGMKFEINPMQKLGIRQLKDVDRVEYEKAINQVSFPLKETVTCNVYFLDYKLKDYTNTMALSFKDKSIVVFGSYFPVGQVGIHQLAVHELGHQIDFQLMDEKKWAEYIKLRGIDNSKIYNNASQIHSNRPQEIFAEDFRMIFGGETAQKIPHLNKDLQDPSKNQKTKEFFLGLAE